MAPRLPDAPLLIATPPGVTASGEDMSVDACDAWDALDVSIAIEGREASVGRLEAMLSFMMMLWLCTTLTPAAASRDSASRPRPLGASPAAVMVGLVGADDTTRPSCGVPRMASTPACALASAPTSARSRTAIVRRSASFVGP